MASSEFEQLDLEVPFHSSIFEDPHLMSNLDMYQPMQLPDENLVVSCQPLLLDFTSGQGDGANIVAETGVPFPLSQASADENPTFESHTGGLKEQPVRPIFGPSKPVELPPKSSRRKRESKARTKERKLRSVRRQACWKCRKDHKSVGCSL